MGIDFSDAGKDYMAGVAAGVATVITGHPFDTVKVNLQAHNTKTHMEYRNAFHCTSRILANEGVKGLYRGASSSFIGMAFESSLLIGTYSQTKQFLQGEAVSSRPQLQAIIPAAALGGSMISFILCPAELVKCRMQVQQKNVAGSNFVRYAGPLDCAIKTMKTDGMTGIFRGGVTTLLRESIGNAFFFTTYEYSRHYLLSNLPHTSSRPDGMSNMFSDFGVGIISGGVAGMAFWSTVLPFDVAKTIIQTSPDSNYSRNPIFTLKSIYRRVGLKGWYAGLGPTLARAFPANAAAMATWEFTAKILGVRRTQVQLESAHMNSS